MTCAVMVLCLSSGFVNDNHVLYMSVLVSQLVWLIRLLSQCTDVWSFDEICKDKAYIKSVQKLVCFPHFSRPTKQGFL